MQIKSINIEIGIQILKANIHMQKSNWTKKEKQIFWDKMKLEASNLKQNILPINFLMNDIKGYPEIKQ